MAITRTGITFGRNTYEVNGDGVIVNREAKAVSSSVNGTPEVKYAGARGYNALRGLLAQEDDLDKTLIFQFNPETITDQKVTTYADRNYTGLPFNAYIWTNGAERTITFQLFMDATAGSNTKTFRKDVQWGNAGNESLAFTSPRGTLDNVELLNSFLYPRLKVNVSSPSLPVPKFTSGGVVPEHQFIPPPTAIFCYGEYYLRGLVRDVSVTHELFNKDLVPVRSTCDVTFAVLEQTAVVLNATIKGKSTLPPIVR